MISCIDDQALRDDMRSGSIQAHKHKYTSTGQRHSVSRKYIVDHLQIRRVDSGLLALMDYPADPADPAVEHSEGSLTVSRQLLPNKHELLPSFDALTFDTRHSFIGLIFAVALCFQFSLVSTPPQWTNSQNTGRARSWDKISGLPPV